MTVTLELNPELEERVQAQAIAQGISIEAYLLSLIEAAALPAPGESASLEEFEAAMDAFSEGTEGLPVLTAEAMSRESIYGHLPPLGQERPPVPEPRASLSLRRSGSDGVGEPYRIELTLEQREAVLCHFGRAADAVSVTMTGVPTEFYRAEWHWREIWGRAEALRREGNTDEALVLAREAVRTFPTAHGHCWLASLLLAVGQSREALAAYQAAIRLSPSGSDSYLELGRALVRAGAVEELIEEYRAELGEEWQVPLLSRSPDPLSLFLDQQPNARARSACRRSLEEGLWGVELAKILEILSVPSDWDELWNVTGTAEAWRASERRHFAVVEAFFEFCEDQGYLLR